MSCWYDLLREKRRELVTFYFKGESDQERQSLEDTIQSFWLGSLSARFPEESARGFRHFWDAASLHPDLSPLMLKFVKLLAGIAASEAECERLFSAIRDDLGDHRHSMQNASLFVNLVLSWKQRDKERKGKS
jgi:hypothetical protein